MNEIYNNVLVYDIETITKGKPNPEEDKFRLFCCYSYRSNKYYCTKDKSTIQLLIDKHKFLVGFNNEYYDNPILAREGIRFKYKIIVDLLKIFKQRAGSMKTKKGMLGNVLMRYNLDYLTKFLDLVDDKEGKLKIDYNMFTKETLTLDEENEMRVYAKRDVEVTKKLYEWIETYFKEFRGFLKPIDVEKKIYLTASIAKFAYKVICKEMKWEESYSQDVVEGDVIGGGYVAYPAGERFEGDIYLMDFRSLYPHIMIQCNLYGRKKDVVDDRPTWFGGNKWKVEGVYYSDKLSPVGELLKKWYQDRLEYKKKGDRREYTLKILLNTVYGVSDNSHYSLVYDKIAAGDCTRLGRQWIKYARKKFRKAGYLNIMSDTDSCAILDKFKDKDKLLKVKDEIINDIKKTVPFPQKTFNMGIDDEISHMFFFKSEKKEKKRDEDEEIDEDDFINKPKNFLKKNYIYLTKDKDVIIKNLGVRKKSISELTRVIFWQHIVPKIKEEGNVKFSKAYFKNLIMELLEKNIELAALRKDVGPFSQYVKTSPTGLQAQISKMYGPGVHFLIPNTKGIGVGKGKKFCTIEEFKDRRLTYDNIDLTNVYKELEYFMKPVITKNIFDFAEEE